MTYKENNVKDIGVVWDWTTVKFKDSAAAC